MVETRIFRGVTFRRYPAAAGWAERAYFTPGQAARERGVGRLHEEVWKAAHGPIPPGHAIHHIDFDSLNNDLSNLQCVDDDTHQAIHVEHRRLNGLYEAPTPQALAAAAEWHASDEGREWHRQHAAAIGFGAGDPREKACEQCGETYVTTAPHDNVRFCSNRCKAAWRRASGVDDEDRACARCSAVFRVNRYSSRRFCSRTC